MRRDDLVTAISGRGNSENIIRAVDYANDNGGEKLSLCGYEGGKLRERVQHAVWVQVSDIQQCEDSQAMFGRIVMQKLRISNNHGYRQAPLASGTDVGLHLPYCTCMSFGIYIVKML